MKQSSWFHVLTFVLAASLLLRQFRVAPRQYPHRIGGQSVTAFESPVPSASARLPVPIAAVRRPVSVLEFSISQRNAAA